jgi:uncharacterized membrane protein
MQTKYLVAVAMLWATGAKADLTFCNDGPEERRVAIAYSDSGVWTSEGWWKLPPAACTVVVAGDLTRQHYYYHTSQDDASSDYSFCVQEQAFTLPGADGDCAALGADERRFAHIDTGETAKNFVFHLPVEAPPVANPATAKSAEDGAAVPSFAPGTYGEPFTVNALLQGCETRDEGAFCTVIAEGFRWVAAQGGPSNPAALDRLATMSVNSPLIVTGDITSYGDITAEMVISSIEPGTPDAWATLRDAMQGGWVSTEDPLSVIDIYGSEHTRVYDGEILEVALATWANACPDGAEIGPVIYTQIMGGDPMDTTCLAILEVTEDRMDLSYVGRGNTLSYVRLPMGE